MKSHFFGFVAFLTVVAVGNAATIDEANTLWLRGNYAEALEKYEALKEEDPEAVAIGGVRCLRSLARYSDAEQMLDDAVTRFPGSAQLRATLADLHRFRGRYAEALAATEEAKKLDDQNLLARWVRAQVLAVTGKLKDANDELEWFVQFYNQKQPADAETLLLVALAVSDYARWNKYPDEFDFILNTLLVDASAANPDDWRPAWYAGSLLVEKYNQAQGVPELRRALKINPNATEALVVLGESALQDYDFAEGHRYADQALKVSPNFPSALRLKADLLLADSRTEEAITQLKAALSINPVSEATLGRLAACYYVQKMPDRAAALQRQAVEVNPKPGVFFTALADQLEKRRQFDLAEKCYRQAIDAAPHLAGPWNGLGMLFMRVGKEDDARRTFKEARALDPFHVRISNMSKVLDHLADYKVYRTEHYEVYVRADKDDLLGRYMSEYLEGIHGGLCEQFGYRPAHRTKIEILIDHAWFSARVVGLPRVGTVGACTGRVVALASPRSLKTPFNWARVLTHEVTHIITLEQTNYNIPHWFTEALAVHSEGYPRPPIWNHLLAERVPKGDVLNLDNINHAFVRPKTPLDWQMAYCQSLLYAQYMMTRFGKETIASLLDAYRDGYETDEAIKKVFGIEKKSFEEGYIGYLQKVVRGLKVEPAKEKRSFAEAERAFREAPEDAGLAADLALHYLARRNVTEARKLANKALAVQKDHPLALYILARMELSIGKVDEATALLEPGFHPDDPHPQVLELLASLRVRKKQYDQAAELYQQAHEADPSNVKWLEGLARVHLLTRKDTKLAPVLEKLANMDADNLAVRKKLVELMQKEKQWELTERWAREVMHIDVSDAEAHRALADAAMAQKKYLLAAREFEATAALDPQDTDASVKIAEAYLGAGETEKARGRLLQILETNPDHRRAKELFEGLSRP